MYISDFQYHKPDSVVEACRILADSSDGVPLAGGTDLLVEIKQGLRHHKDIVSLANIKELKSISEDEENLYIGAGVTHNDIVESPVLKKKFPSIVETASNIGTDQVRNTGTIGGNLCTGASCCDMAPILFALNAKVEIANSTIASIIPLKEFFISHKITALEKGEIMLKVIIPLLQHGTGACYEKFGLREAASIAVASTAVMIKVQNRVCTDACIVIGAVASTPKISTRANEQIIGKNISELSENSIVLKKMSEAAAGDSIPIDDIRGTANYRRDLIKGLAKRAAIKATASAIS